MTSNYNGTYLLDTDLSLQSSIYKYLQNWNFFHTSVLFSY